MTQKLGISKPTLKPIQSDGEIFIVNEYAAFPLRLIEGLGQMREQYNRQCQYDMSLFHNDYNQIFSEIIPPNAQVMEELQDVFYACIALGILKEESQSYIYEYIDGFLGRTEQVKLSTVWTEALEQLATSESISQDLKKEREKVFDDIRHDPTQWHQEYLPKLRAFIERVSKLTKTDPNYLEVSTVLGENATIDKPAKQGILRRLWDYLQNESLIRTDIKSLGTSVDKQSNNISLNNSEIIDAVDILEEKTELSGNLIQELEKLAYLQEQGFLSDDEVRLAKRKLLS